MFLAWNMLDFEVKKIKPCYPFDYQCTRNICVGAIELRNKNVGVSFQNKIDPIQPMLDLLEGLKNPSALLFYCIIYFLL